MDDGRSLFGETVSRQSCHKDGRANEHCGCTRNEVNETDRYDVEPPRLEESVYRGMEGSEGGRAVQSVARMADRLVQRGWMMSHVCV